MNSIHSLLREFRKCISTKTLRIQTILTATFLVQNGCLSLTNQNQPKHPPNRAVGTTRRRDSKRLSAEIAGFVRLPLSRNSYSLPTRPQMVLECFPGRAL